MKTLFLSPPSFDGFDGGAGARYQAKREVTSFWYPTWLAQPAALVPGSTLVDAAPHGLGVDDVLKIAAGHDLVVMHTSTPSLPNDVECARRSRQQNPNAKVGFIGAHVAVLPEIRRSQQNPIIDFVCRNNFDYTCRGTARKAARGTRSWGSRIAMRTASCTRMPERPDDRRLGRDAERAADLRRSSSTSASTTTATCCTRTFRGTPAAAALRSARSACGRTRSAGTSSATSRPRRSAAISMKRRAIFGDRVAEYMFDDDTLTGEKEYAIALSKHMKRLKLSWACNARAHVDYDTLKALRDNGLRVLLVGFESGNQEILHRIRKGLNLAMAREFMKNCHKLGIKVHGTFIIGLPVETPETVRETIEFAKELDPHTIQVSIASPYPGTVLYDQALANGWFARQDLVSGSNGIQTSTLAATSTSRPAEIEDSVERMYREFYFRPKKIAKIVAEMITSRQMMVRRLREGGEFFDYLRRRHIVGGASAAERGRHRLTQTARRIDRSTAICSAAPSSRRTARSSRSICRGRSSKRATSTCCARFRSGASRAAWSKKRTG